MPGVVGEGDRRHLETAEQAAQRGRADRQRHAAVAHGIGSGRPVGVARAGRRLGPALHRERERRRRCRRPRPPPARPAVRRTVDRNVTSAGPVTKTTSSTTLSTANAVCRSRRPGAGRPSARAPSTPICGMAAPASAPRTWGRGSAQSSVIETIIRPLVEREDDGVDVQHRALAEPVGQPPVRYGEGGVADDVGRRHLPGQRRRSRSACSPAARCPASSSRSAAGPPDRGRERQGAGVGEDPAVGGEHPGRSLGDLQAGRAVGTTHRLVACRRDSRLRFLRDHVTRSRTTRSCSSPSVGPRSPTTSSRSCATSPPGGTSPTSGSRRWASTTSTSVAAARSTTRTGS